MFLPGRRISTWDERLVGTIVDLVQRSKHHPPVLRVRWDGRPWDTHVSCAAVTTIGPWDQFLVPSTGLLEPSA
jgi:hypothetical protein